MNRTGTGMLGCALLMGWVALGEAGFLDEVVKQGLGTPAAPPSGSNRPAAPASQESGQSPGLVDGLGGLIGVDRSKLDLVKKGLNTVRALQPIGIEEEVAIGRAIALEAFNRFGGEYVNPAMQKYLNLVGRTVAQFSDRPELGYRFAILNSDEENAFAAPGGYILVTRGLLRRVENEAQLAGVLAHEIAHVSRRHMLETIQRSALLSNASELTVSVMKQDPGMFRNLVGEVSDKLFTHGLDQSLEFDADAQGLRYLYMAGYNLPAYRGYLAGLQKRMGQSTSVFYSTHPSLASRLEKLDKELPRHAGGSKLPVLDGRLRKSLSFS
ncbi:MAG: M48 family metalloprotease [Magnetococcales bacterium]|nr:M48 family metalloprotease [Magnetococcales bacterium]